MKLNITVSALTELVALGLLVAGIALGFGLWPSLLAGGVALEFLSHAWVNEPDDSQ